MNKPPDLAIPGPHWRWESPKPQGNNLRSVWGVAGASSDLDQLYIGGDSGTVLVGGNAGWSMPRAGNSDFRSILAVAGQGSGSQALVLGVGVYDLALLQQSGSFRDLNPVLGTGDGALNAVWATPTAGTFFVVGTTGRIFQVVNNGTSFQQEGKGITTDSLFGVTGTGTGNNLDVYAVGANGRIIHRQAGIWTVENTLFTQQLNSVFIAPSGEVFAVGDSGTILRRQMGSWQSEPVATTVQLTAVWGAADEVYAVGARGTILRRKAGAWTAESAGLTGELLSALWGTVRGAEITVYAVGNSGTILRRDRGNWTTISSRATQSSLSAIWARNANEIYAVGSGGTVLRRSGSGDQGTWAEAAKGLTTASLNAVAGYAASGSGEADVYAVGADGTILHKPATTWDIEGVALTSQELTGVAHSGGAAYVVGLGGVVAKKVGTSWSPDLPMLGVGMPVTTDLYAVWTSGQGTSQVTYAVGAGGMILRRDNTSWTREANGLTTESLIAIFGSNDQNLYAFGSKGTTLKRSSGSWKVETVKQFSGGARGSAGCLIPGTTDLLAVGTQGVIVRRFSNDWTSESSLTTQPLSGVAATGTNDLYAVGSSGLVLHKY